MDARQNDIKRLQDNLNAIRRIAGWTAQELGDRIGVTKQTISNLENQKTEMTLTQYIALRTILDYEIENNKANTMLPQAVHLLLDMPKEKAETEDNKKNRQIIMAFAAACAGGAALKDLIPLSSLIAGGYLGLKTWGGSERKSPAWLHRLMKKEQ